MVYIIMNIKLIVFFLLVLASYTTEKLSIKCKTGDNLIQRESLSLAHHTLVTWVYFGSFIFNTHYRLHLLVLLFIAAQWDVVESYTGIYGCSLSLVYNNLCGIKHDTSIQDLAEKIGFWKVALVTAMYDLYFISKGNI